MRDVTVILNDCEFDYVCPYCKTIIDCELDEGQENDEICSICGRSVHVVKL